MADRETAFQVGEDEVSGLDEAWPKSPAERLAFSGLQVEDANQAASSLCVEHNRLLRQGERAGKKKPEAKLCCAMTSGVGTPPLAGTSNNEPPGNVRTKSYRLHARSHPPTLDVRRDDALAAIFQADLSSVTDR